MRRRDNTKTDLPLTRWSPYPILLGLGVGVLAGPAGLHLLEPHVPMARGQRLCVRKILLAIINLRQFHAYGWDESGRAVLLKKSLGQFDYLRVVRAG